MLKLKCSWMKLLPTRFNHVCQMDFTDFFFLPLFGWRLCVCTNKVVTVCLVFLEFHIIKLIAIAISIRLFFLYHKIFSVYGRHPIAPFYNLQLLTHRIIRSRNWH